MEATSRRKTALGAVAAVGLFLPLLARAAALEGITPGKTTRAEIRQRLGEPAEGKDTAIESFAGQALGFAKIIVHYDAQNVARKAKLCPDKEAALADTAALFTLASAPKLENGNAFDPAEQGGSTVRYDAEGVSFYLRDGVVREIWLVEPAAQGQAPTAVETPPVTPPGPPAGPATAPTSDPLKEVRVSRTPEGTWPSFLTLVPGKSKRADVVPLLGHPRFISRAGRETLVSGYDGERFGLHSINLYYRSDDLVERIELRPTKPIELSAVSRALSPGNAGQPLPIEGASITCFEADGIELTFRDDGVIALSLVSPSAGPTLAAPKLPEAVTTPQPQTLPPTTTPPVPPSKGPSVQLTGVRHEPAALEGRQGLTVLAEVGAAGLQGQTMTVSVRLRQPTGQPVMAVRGTKGPLLDSHGRACVIESDAVRFNPARWAAYRVFVPYDILDLPRGQEHALILAVTAACGGKSVTLEIPCTLTMP